MTDGESPDRHRGLPRWPGFSRGGYRCWPHILIRDPVGVEHSIQVVHLEFDRSPTGTAEGSKMGPSAGGVGRRSIDPVGVGIGGCRENRRENQTFANRGKYWRTVVSGSQTESRTVPGRGT